MRKQTLLLFLLLMPCASLLGCADNTNQPSPKVGQGATLQQQLDAIDNNPNMPAQAKAAAKAEIQAHQNMDLSAGKK